MTNAILLHGLTSEKEYFNEEYPSSSNSHWLPWLQKRLLMAGINTATPEVPKPFEMSWNNWVKEIERFEINENTILVGHSMGGGFWIKYLTERPTLKVKKVVLVAPWLNLGHEVDSDFFNFELKKQIQDQAGEFVIYASDNDMQEVQRTTDFLKSNLLKAKYVGFHYYGHFCYRDLKTDEFPELLSEITA